MACFLGWCEVAQVDLGSKALIPKVGYSNGRTKEKSLELNRFTLSAVRNASSDVASVQIQINYTFRTLLVHFEPSSILQKVADRHI